MEFDSVDKLKAIRPLGNGHINVTNLIETTTEKYVLQKVNTHVFKNPIHLMENFYRVASHLAKKLKHPHHTIELMYCQDKPYYDAEEVGFYRLYKYIDDATTFNVVKNSKMAFQVASAFGTFSQMMEDLPGERLHETIPNFHNTSQHFARLEKAIAENKFDRLKEVSKEMDFALSRCEDCSRLIKMQSEGLLKERITHNDTDIMNVLLNQDASDWIAIIDLDTVMPGLPHYDFGDMVRSATSPTRKDETDLSLVQMRFEIFEALLRGYLSKTGDSMSDIEIEELPFSCKLLALELGIRFLTDYLEGDIYFRVHHPRQNLDRCRFNFKLAESIGSQFDNMHKLIKNIRK